MCSLVLFYYSWESAVSLREICNTKISSNKSQCSDPGIASLAAVCSVRRDWLLSVKKSVSATEIIHVQTESTQKTYSIFQY